MNCQEQGRCEFKTLLCKKSNTEGFINENWESHSDITEDIKDQREREGSGTWGNSAASTVP
jgi:hypothetical protein